MFFMLLAPPERWTGKHQTQRLPAQSSEEAKALTPDLQAPEL